MTDVEMWIAPQLETYWRLTGEWPSGLQRCEYPRQYSVEAVKELMAALKMRHKKVKWTVKRYEYWEHVTEEEI